MKLRQWLPVLAACVALAGCGSAPGDRALSGAGIGAGTGAAVGAVFGGVGVVPGALIGAGLGAGTGYLTTQRSVNLGEPVWR